MASPTAAAAVSASTFVGLPRIMYGTAWKAEKTTELVVRAVRAGYRAIDTACQPKHYSEDKVGEALEVLSKEHGIPRESLFVQTKFTPVDGQDPKRIPYDRKAELAVQVEQSLAVSLKNLRTTYLDSLVLHSPLGSLDKTMVVWDMFESFQRAGVVRHLGISNCYDVGLLRNIHERAGVKPTFIQNRLYPDTKHDVALREFCRSADITYQSFWTLTGNPGVLQSPAVTGPADRLGKTPAQVWFRYCVHRGIIPLTGTQSDEHMRQDLECTEPAGAPGAFELGPDEVAAIAALIGEPLAPQ